MTYKTAVIQHRRIVHSEVDMFCHYLVNAYQDGYHIIERHELPEQKLTLLILSNTVPTEPLSSEQVSEIIRDAIAVMG